MVAIIMGIIGILISLLLGFIAVALGREAIIDCRFNRTQTVGDIIVLVGIGAISILLAVASITLLRSDAEKCPECNANRNNGNYCITCGHAYDERNICVCGKDNKSKALYCQNCGRALKEEPK